MNPVQRTTAFLLLAFLVGCASLALPTPETFREKLAAGNATITEVATSAETLRQSGKISDDDAQNIKSQCQNLLDGLKVARSLSTTDMTSANNRLAVITTSLKALQGYLLTKEK